MRMIDPHLHLDRMKGKDVETLSIAGVEGAVLPTPHMLQWIVSAETLLRMWRMFLDFEVKHSESLGIKVFVTLSVPFYGLETESVAEALRLMPEYLDHPSIVGLGEIGMDAMGFLMDMPLRDVLSFRENALPMPAGEIVDGLLTQLHGQDT